MNKKDVILGKAKTNGLPRKKLQALSGIPSATFTRRMKNPDDITLAELRRLDQLAHFDDTQLIGLIRNKHEE